MLARRLINSTAKQVVTGRATFSQLTNRKHRDMGGGGHIGADPVKDHPFYEDPHAHHGDHHHDDHAHPVFHLPFSQGEALTFSWGILFSGLAAIWLSCEFQQRKQGFTVRKDRFTE